MSSNPTLAELVNDRINDARTRWLLLQTDITELRATYPDLSEHMDALEGRFPDLLKQADAAAGQGSPARTAIASLVNLATSPTKQSSPLGKAIEAVKERYGEQQSDDNLLQFMMHASELSGCLAIIGDAMPSLQPPSLTRHS